MILRVIFFILAVIQNTISIKLISVLLEYPLVSNKFMRVCSVLLCAGSQLVMTFSSSPLSPALRLAVLILLMLTKACGYCMIFGKCNLAMFYLSPLAFVISSNYSNIFRLITTNSLQLNTISCAAEAATTLLLMIYITRYSELTVVTRSLHIIPKRLYIAVLMFLYLMSLFEFVSLSRGFTEIARFLILPVTVMCIYIISKIIHIYTEELEHKRISDLLVLQFENQAEYYERINALYTEFRAFRHDFRNHLSCLYTLIEENENEKALSYLNNIEIMSHTEKKLFDTGNIIVDSLLDSKSEKAGACNTRIVFNGTAPGSGILNADMCTIFSNALDNAIEACEKSPDTNTRYINIDSEFHQGYYFIRFTNPVFEQLHVGKGGQLSTSKADKSIHGFGIANIIKTVKKYDGETKIYTDNDNFVLEVELWQKLSCDV